jgi:hypothetical protein
MTRATRSATIPVAFASLLLALGASAADAPAIQVAKFTSEGQLLRPEGMENWVFVGTALGMGYNEAQFNPAKPGLFQVVQMEPTAWALSSSSTRRCGSGSRKKRWKKRSRITTSADASR